jgi:hypothetical protein
VLIAAALAGAQAAATALALLVPPWAAPGIGVTAASDGRIEVAGPARAYTYLPGVGWSPFLAAPAPRIVDGTVLLPREVVIAAGSVPADLPIVEAFRGADREGSLRVVLDLDRPQPRPADLETQTGVFSVPVGAMLARPEALAPVRTSAGTARIGFATGQMVIRFEIARGGSVLTSVLTGPDRLVLDAFPRLAVRPVEEEREIFPGVIYRRFGTNTAVGPEQAHAILIRPGAAGFRVAAAPPGTGARLSELAGGAIAAINAGYFDTRTLHPVGLLIDQGAVYGTGFLGRGAVGFTADGRVLIGRPDLSLAIRSGGSSVPVAVNTPAARIALHNRAGETVGLPGEAAVVAIDGQVIGRLPAPATVPGLGFVLTYPLGQIRSQPLTVRPGTALELELNWIPGSWSAVTNAVEAGPVLVAAGHDALDFAGESFRADSDIATARTAQSGIGVLPDGTVLLVVTERTTTREFKDLFLALGAVQALRLDGGSSTGLIVGDRVVNRTAERRITSAILVLPPHGDTLVSEVPPGIAP